MKICMIGAGYVGLVSAVCFSEFGWSVTCVDKERDRVDALRRGEVPIYEPGLDDLLVRNMAAKRLSFTQDLAAAAAEADLIFLAVGTPMRRGDGHADLSYVFAAVEEISPHLTGFTVITTKSTVPVGTSREIERRLRKLRPDADFAVCSNPEFLREGSAIQDFTHPDRVLVGCDEPRARAIMERLYKPLALRNAPIDVRQPRIGRARQVCGQCLPGDEDQLHQRDGGSVRGGRRQRAGGRFRHRQGPAHRRQVPASGAGLRRLVLPEGCLRARPHGPRGTGRRCR